MYARTPTGTVSAAKTESKKRKPEPALDPMCMRRIMKEFTSCKQQDSRAEMGIQFDLVNEDNPLEWSAKWYYDMADDSEWATETQKALARQLKQRDLDYIEFRMVFPTTYPTEAPFVYNYYPRLVGSYIFGAGGLCAQTLSTEYGWSPASRASYLMLTVRSLLENAGCRLQRVECGHCSSRAVLEKPFDEAGARADFKAIAGLHSRGWGGSAGKS